MLSEIVNLNKFKSNLMPEILPTALTTWADMVGTTVRSLLSDRKVPSSIPALSRFELLV